MFDLNVVYTDQLLKLRSLLQERGYRNSQQCAGYQTQPEFSVNSSGTVFFLHDFGNFFFFKYDIFIIQMF